MYLLYCDASGTPEIKDPQSAVYVLLGVSVHERAWFALENRVRDLKARYEMDGHPIELHAADFSCHIREQDLVSGFEAQSWSERRTAVEALRGQKLANETSPDRKGKLRKDHRRTAPFLHLTGQERSRLLGEVLDLVGSMETIRLFGEAVHKPWLLRASGESSSTRHGFEQVVSRFDSFLSFANRNGPSANQGLLVLDNDPNSEETIRKLTDQFRSVGHRWGRMHHVMESPFFVDSRMASGVQLADICAYVVRRYIERADQGETVEKLNFLKIFPRFDRGAYKLHGLRHYCQRGSCDCLICQERGHAEGGADGSASDDEGVA